ncbi:hypothetical protein M1E08_05980 [Erwinia sp. PK3-005]|uniref:Uncharacterized protein n=1 Tax=Mixta hanseatica TaxID=2872648 RepID=A0ABY4R655_9GAMM|nr:hypothetical protein [Mixta hanseatica]UQY43077.1 hypothetical protein K6958_14350 [Mixta hanseatica]
MIKIASGVLRLFDGVRQAAILKCHSSVHRAKFGFNSSLAWERVFDLLFTPRSRYLLYIYPDIILAVRDNAWQAALIFSLSSAQRRK